MGLCFNLFSYFTFYFFLSLSFFHSFTRSLTHAHTPLTSALCLRSFRCHFNRPICMYTYMYKVLDECRVQYASNPFESYSGVERQCFREIAWVVWCGARKACICLDEIHRVEENLTKSLWVFSDSSFIIVIFFRCAAVVVAPLVLLLFVVTIAATHF